MSEEKKKTHVREFKQRKLVKEDLIKMNLPEEFWRTKLDPVPATETTPARPGVDKSVRIEVESYLLNINARLVDGIGLILCGGIGSGKTAIASLIAREASAWCHSVLFVHVDELRDLVASHTYWNDQTTVLERARRVDFLILDGVRGDIKEDKVFGHIELESLLSGRAAHKRPTIVTTRLNFSKFGAAFPILHEATKGSLVFMAVEGPNLRDEQQKAAEQIIFSKKES